MAIENLIESRVVTGLLTSPRVLAAPGLAGGAVRVTSFLVEVTAAASDTSTYHIARLPSNARILGLSHISTDDLASSGAPTLDIGCYPINSEFTADVDAINDGIDAAAATNSRLSFIKAAVIENFGKRLWEFINGVTVDPKCLVDIKIVMDDADTNTGGTISGEIYWTCD